MASPVKTQKNSGAGKPRVSATQKKIRQQQVGMAILAIVMVIAMVLALVIR